MTDRTVSICHGDIYIQWRHLYIYIYIDNPVRGVFNDTLSNVQVIDTTNLIQWLL